MGSFLVTFAGGARWLLLLLPVSVLARMSGSVQLANTGLDTGPNLLAALSQPWAAEGSASFPFPFAFHNGIFVPVMFSLGASGALPFVAILVLLLLSGRARLSIPAVILFSLIFAALALSAEHLFVFLWAGIALASMIYIFRHRNQISNSVKNSARRPAGGQPAVNRLLFWPAVLLFSGILSVLQGAFITEAVRSVLLQLQGQSVVQGHYNYFQFVPHWPPTLVSAHFGELSLLNPGQLTVLLAELGPALLLGPLATVFAWRRIRRGDFLLAGLGLAAALTLLVALFFRYGVERSSTRLPATSLWLWVLLAFPLAWRWFQTAARLPRVLLRLAYGAAVFGGIVIFAVQLLAIPAPQLTTFINSNDASLSQELWNRLPAGAEILDRVPYRAVALFGRPSRAYIDFYHSLPTWKSLIKSMDPEAIAGDGYSFIYMDDDWWWELEPEQQEHLLQPCVEPFAVRNPEDEDFRWLLDVRSCK
jgi:hypothetical protein